MTDDARALSEWSAAIAQQYATRSRPPGGPVARAIAYPRWGATVFYRKTREIGFLGATRLAIDVASARLRARR